MRTREVWSCGAKRRVGFRGKSGFFDGVGAGWAGGGVGGGGSEGESSDIV